MGFKEVIDLDCDTTTALGGVNRQTGKPNPTQIEGYFIGSRRTPSKKSRTGIALLHILQTAKGNVGVWGKTDLDRKISAVESGYMIRITQSGTVATPNGDMYKFKVEVDTENRIEVDLPKDKADEEEAPAAEVATDEDTGVDGEDAEEMALDEEEAPMDEVPPARPAPARRAVTPPAANQAKVQELLNKRRAAK